MKKVFTRVLFITFAVFSIFNLSSVQAIQSGCSIQAKVLTVEHRTVKENDDSPKILALVNMKIELLENAVVVGKKKDLQATCSELVAGKEFEVSAVRQRDFMDPQNPNKIVENSLVRGLLHVEGRGRKATYTLTNIDF